MSARLSVNVNDETAAALKKISEERGITVTEVIRRSVSVYKFIEDETGSGKVLQLTDTDRNETTNLAII